MPDREPSFFVTLLRRLRNWWDEAPQPSPAFSDSASAFLDHVGRCADAEIAERRACTCHPDDNPPRPCPRKFALSECRDAAETRST